MNGGAIARRRMRASRFTGKGFRSAGEAGISPPVVQQAVVERAQFRALRLIWG
jgi:hypothetical protein